MGDLAYLGVHSRFSDTEQTMPGGNKCSGVYHIGPVSQREIFPGKYMGLLDDGIGLAGQGGFVGSKFFTLKDPAVCGNQISQRQADQVAGNQKGRENGLLFSLPQNQTVRCLEGVQRFQSLVRPEFLIHTKAGIHNKDSQNDERINIISLFREKSCGKRDGSG